MWWCEWLCEGLCEWIWLHKIDDRALPLIMLWSLSNLQLNFSQLSNLCCWISLSTPLSRSDWISLYSAFSIRLNLSLLAFYRLLPTSLEFVSTISFPLWFTELSSLSVEFSLEMNLFSFRLDTGVATVSDVSLDYFFFTGVTAVVIFLLWYGMKPKSDRC
jgi:hypothetical protein